MFSGHSFTFAGYLWNYTQESTGKPISIVEVFSPYLSTIALDDTESLSHLNYPGGGVFFEKTISDLGELLPLLNRKCQTVASFGITKQEWEELLQAHVPRGIDRIVPLGRANAFSEFWDGYDLLGEFTREVVVDVT